MDRDYWKYTHLFKDETHMYLLLHY